MHLDSVFPKFGIQGASNVLCLGREGIGKSTLLNDLFGFNFETSIGIYTEEMLQENYEIYRSTHQCRIFHDSVDAIFASEQVRHCSQNMKNEMTALKKQDNDRKRQRMMYGDLSKKKLSKEEAVDDDFSTENLMGEFGGNDNYNVQLNVFDF